MFTSFKIIHQFQINSTALLIPISVFIGLLILFSYDKILKKQNSKEFSEIQNGLMKLCNGDVNFKYRIPMKKVNCSSIKKCNNKECDAYEKDTSCWDIVGSNAPTNIKCSALLSGELKSCHDCEVMKSAMKSETDELKGWINTYLANMSRNVV